VSLAMVECGLDVFARTDMHAVRTKSLALTDLFISLLDSKCAGHNLALVTPREHHLRGSHVSVSHPHAYGVMCALIDHGLIGDYREPSVMRFGFTPLYTRFVDVWDAVQTLQRILGEADYQADRRQHAVT
jgi:kynureninase